MNGNGRDDLYFYIVSMQSDLLMQRLTHGSASVRICVRLRSQVILFN